jgi:hypothetical protein
VLRSILNNAVLWGFFTSEIEKKRSGAIRNWTVTGWEALVHGD